MSFNGVQMNLGNIAKLSDAKSRSISAENVYGQKGSGAMAEISDSAQAEVERIGQYQSNCQCGRELGRGWKVRPCSGINGGETTTFADIEGPGVIQHIWFAVPGEWHRNIILRMFWDDEEEASVEVPMGDFFCNGFPKIQTNIYAQPINVNPVGGFNSYFPMPFRKRARITVENVATEACPLYYTVDYALTEIEEDDAYFHAQFRRTNPLPYKEEYTILDGVTGKGQYVGTYMAWYPKSHCWWGEGEIKFFMDGDGEYPTICGTGTEDYFGGAYCFGKWSEDPQVGLYSAPFMGHPYGSIARRAGDKQGLYRFHIMDPIRFEEDLKVTMQALGWRSEGRFLPLQDDIASVAYWYQREPHGSFPKMPDKDGLEVI